jgi:hypothetical protein
MTLSLRGIALFLFVIKNGVHAEIFDVLTLVTQ